MIERRIIATEERDTERNTLVPLMQSNLNVFFLLYSLFSPFFQPSTLKYALEPSRVRLFCSTIFVDLSPGFSLTKCPTHNRRHLARIFPAPMVPNSYPLHHKFTSLSALRREPKAGNPENQIGSMNPLIPVHQDSFRLVKLFQERVSQTTTTNRTC